MKHKLLFCLLFLTQQVIAQYKYDNTSFKTIYLNDLCEALQKNPSHLLLDVRSKGEFYDTSTSASLNIGHLKGATNFDITDLQKRWKELLPYKDQPIFVYCSHSQRSRKVSKFLSDSGFTKIYNINGAMTEFNLLKNTDISCSKELYETNNQFKLIAPGEVARLLLSKKNLFILDVRSDSAFKGISRDAQANAMGRLKGASNIPFAQLAASLDKIPKNTTILVTADYGRETNLAATLLTEKGFTDVYAAFNGMNQWISASEKELPMRRQLWENSNGFTIITAEEMDAMLTRTPNTYILDARSKEEFTNEVKKDTWRNRGHVPNAVNIPATELANRANEIASYKNKDIILYTFGSNPEAFEAASTLAANGFTKVHVLAGGLWDIRWKAANLKGLSHLMKWVVDVPEDNL
ncbi:MAG: rhodanese-like domain-containing protein [Bacteroidota bacterium]